MEISIKIPLQPFLHKYLLKELGQPYVLTKKDPIGKVLLAHVTRPEDIRPARSFKNEVFFKINLPNYFWCKVGITTLTQENENQFIDYVKDLFYKDLCIWVSSRMELKYSDKKRITPAAVKKSDALLDFCKVYDINVDDVNMDTLFKVLQRKLKRWRHAPIKG